MRVLQVNIWARHEPYERRAVLLRREVEALDPDLISLQEVDASGEAGNQAEELFASLGYQIAYERREGELRGEPGIAIASRFPIAETRTTDLGHGGPALAARIRIGPEALWFCSTVPMSWKPGFEGQREDECVALDQWLSDLAETDEIPPIIGGDFDATPEGASIRFLTGMQSLHGRSTYWIDASAAAGDGSPGYTLSTENPYKRAVATAVYGQPERHRRIDYIFIGSPFRWKPRLVVRAASVVLKQSGADAPSDHYGVMADLDLVTVDADGGRA